MGRQPSGGRAGYPRHADHTALYGQDRDPNLTQRGVWYQVTKAAARFTTSMALPTPDAVHAVVHSVTALATMPIYTLADTAMEVVAEAPANPNGFLGPIVGALEMVLKVLHPQNSAHRVTRALYPTRRLHAS